MDAVNLYNAALDTLNQFWNMNEARRAACRAYQFDGSDASKEAMIRWKVYQGWENALMLQANTLARIAAKVATY